MAVLAVCVGVVACSNGGDPPAIVVRQAEANAGPPDAPVVPATDPRSDDAADPPGSSVPAATTEPATPLPTIQLEDVLAPFGFAEHRGLTGGAGQELFVVTSADDSGPGTYRDALSEGGRYIRFDPALDGATIELRDRVEVHGDDITLDGSGVDVTVTGRVTRFMGTNVIVAGMRFRDNDDTDEEDALTFLDASETQVVGVYGNVFDHAADGLIDFIWNRGNDVFATVCGNDFEHHDKAILIHSGRNGREGGTYHVTLCHNHWYDVYQRAPLSRDAEVHQYNSVFESYGKPDGDGGGSKAGSGDGGSQHFLEDNIAIPRAVGEITFDGSEVTDPRPEYAGPQLDGDGHVRIEGSLLETTGDVTATEVEQDPELVFEPPYEYRSVPATEAVADVIAETAGTCVPSGRAIPCAPLTLLVPGQVIEAHVSGEVAALALAFDGEIVAEAEEEDSGTWRVEVPGDLGTVATMTLVAQVPDGRTATSSPMVIGIVDHP